MKTKPRNRAMGPSKDTQAVAGNGLLDRRAFLRGGAAFAAAITSYSMAKSVSAEPLADDPWSKVPGALSPPYEKRSRYEEKVVRTLSNPKVSRAPSTRAHRTICSTARSRPTGFISRSFTAARRTSIRRSIAW